MKTLITALVLTLAATTAYAEPSTRGGAAAPYTSADSATNGPTSRPHNGGKFSAERKSYGPTSRPHNGKARAAANGGKPAAHDTETTQVGKGKIADGA